jgi:predicted RND superfamily exporter protein
MTRSRLRRILVLLAPVAAVVVLLVVIHGAGIPLTVPGVIVVVLLLVVGRLVFAVTGKRRAGRR